MAGMGILLVVLAVLSILAACRNGLTRFLQARAATSRLAARLGWGALLVAAVVMGVQTWGFRSWTMTVLAGSVLLVVLLPALAANLTAVALLAFGLYGVLLGISWPSAPVPGRGWPGIFYGTITVDGPWTAALAGLEGAALAGFALWLVPRTLGRHRPVAGWARWVPALTGPGQRTAGPDYPAAGPGYRADASSPPAGPRQRPRGVVARAVGERLGQLGWGPVLLPATLIFLPPYDSVPGFAAVAALTLAVVVLLPAVAARIAPIALAGLGLLGIVIALSWALAGLPWRFTDVMYGIAYLDSGRQAALAGVQGLLLLGFALWLAPLTLGGQMTALAGRVQRLAQTRTDAVDVAAAELRRVERDLHDGAQARLVALGMSLRAAERLIHSNPAAAEALVAEARDASSRALTDLRDLVRGIHPPVLADRGLRDAVRALALDTPVRIELDIDLPGRLAAPVESAIYFAIAEALANVVKHAGARSVHIRMAHSGGMLRAEVTDDGLGGASPAEGGGLRGIERRLGTFDGVLAVSSPPGGPTIVVIEVPCELSSPRTYSC
jgi:signal transduction histidine kinase